MDACRHAQNANAQEEFIAVRHWRNTIFLQRHRGQEAKTADDKKSVSSSGSLEPF
jgi:hypothetical protein